MSACTGAAFKVVNLPVSFDKGQMLEGIVYSADEDQRLDIYRPKNIAASAKLPVIVFFYGGRWSGGSRSDYRFVAARLVERGYVVVIPDYRKYPNVKFPAFVEDGAAALGWVHREIARYGGDGDRLYLLGHSAGAHIAALLATDEHYLKARSVPPTSVRAFAGLAGPYAFTPDEPDLIDMFGPPSRYPQMQATTFIDGHEPPMLLLHGADDTTVGRFNYERLAARIREKGGTAETKLYPGIDHIGIMSAFSWVGKNDAPVVQDVTSFFAAHP